MVLGRVLAALKALAAADIEPARIAPNMKFRTNPRSRETTDPEAISTLACSSLARLEGTPARRCRGTCWVRNRLLMGAHRQCSGRRMSQRRVGRASGVGWAARSV